MVGLVSDFGRKNCWTLAERAGPPAWLGYTLGYTSAGSRRVGHRRGVADLRSHVVDHLGDP
jgi:hypothetical protein